MFTLCPHLVISTISSTSGSRPRLAREKISFPLISISRESEDDNDNEQYKGYLYLNLATI